MGIEIVVAPHFDKSAVDGVLRGDVIIQLDGPIEVMQISVLFKDHGTREANERAAISAAKQLAFRFTQ
jgi:hypothetical protein